MPSIRFVGRPQRRRKRPCRPTHSLGLPRENRRQSLKEQVLPNLVCCPGPSVCHLTLPAVLNLAEAAVSKQTDLQPMASVDQMADHRPPTTPAPTVGRALGGRGEAPTVCAKMAPVSLPVPCLAAGGSPGVGSRSLVPGRSSCQPQLEDRDAAFGDPSMFLVGVAAAARLPQIVIHKLLAACRPFANKPSQRGIKRSLNKHSRGR